MVTFVSEDGMIAAVLDNALREQMLDHCMRAGTSETGGILIGHYSALHDQAIVAEVTGPPSDSRAGRWWFVRGVRGLTRRLARAWQDHEYYLGEWHYHPFSDATPSERDVRQILTFAADPAYGCPEPVLFVVGGDPSRAPEIQARVVLGGELQTLSPAFADPTASSERSPRAPAEAP